MPVLPAPGDERKPLLRTAATLRVPAPMFAMALTAMALTAMALTAMALTAMVARPAMAQAASGARPVSWPASASPWSARPLQLATNTTRPASNTSKRRTTAAARTTSSGPARSTTTQPTTTVPPTVPKPLSARTAVKDWDRISADEWPSAGGSITARALARTIEVYRSPEDRAGVLSFTAGRSVAGSVHFLALGVLGDWVRVAIPLRPNGTVGWVRKADVLLIENSYRVVIELGSNRMTVYDGDTMLVDAKVAAGTGGTPTPTGLFFLKELVPQAGNGALGPFAFGLSGYSDVLTSFAGGEGTIGIHGTNSPGRLGTNVSHGCVRVDNANIILMARSLPLGTPVEVVTKLSDAPAQKARRTTDWAFGSGVGVTAVKTPAVSVQPASTTTSGSPTTTATGTPTTTTATGTTTTTGTTATTTGTTTTSAG